MSLLLEPAEHRSRSVFAGADIAATARLTWLARSHRPKFEDDVWSFDGWADASVQMTPAEKTWEFDRIAHWPWRVVAKELALAWIAAQDERVLALPHAHRTPRHPRTVHARLYHLTFWLNWLHKRRITTLAAVTQDHCDAFLHEYGIVRDRKSGEGVRTKAGSSLRTVVLAIQEITDYGELLSADRHRPGFRPWGKRSAREVTGAPARPQVVIKTEPLGDEVLGPLLTACLHLVDVLGPHIVDLRSALRAERTVRYGVDWKRNLRDAGMLASLVDEHLQAGQPLPRLEPMQLTKRRNHGWDPQDPLLDVNFQHLLRPTGHRDIHKALLLKARPMLEEAVAQVGTENVWCRHATEVPRADTGDMLPWTLPLSFVAADSLIRVAAHTCVVATSALTGMRSSELMELTVGCRRTDSENDTGLARHRLVSKVVKGRRWGGEADEWVVIEEVARVIALAEQLTDAAPGQLLFDFKGFESNGAMTWLRKWVTSPAGQRMGLEPIPDDPIHPRRLRRTLSVEMAARPGGLLATKVHFKHLSVATSEGYAARPGGAQAVFHHEWKRAEETEKLRRTVEAYRQFEQGQLPSGPGADALLATFRTVETGLEDHDPGAAKVVTDRQVELLLKQKASVLHLSAANYCWFEDPAKALCLKLAGAKSAASPLTGMCDSARCPQATHHLVHRPVWQSAADNGAVMLASPRVPIAEKQRLRAEHERSTRVLHEIDKASGKAE
ncbi:hypothetical protein [Streptomyces sp. FH025]|uniref:hypothetical protein n=1 Tax=Streptomyces sp. FH025 TaxID=2815937 RepID=UPI001A9E33C9|nr:hypothetical protein [Streptomyces sp. FH025]MBO1417768.1 hypothetical protein [Streptomyces sp. FH025]